MRTAGRPSTLIVLLALLAVLALVAGCSPTSGPLGTPSTPAPTGDASVVPPSGDATPGPAETASASPTPPAASPCCSATPAPPSATPTATPAATPTPTASPSPAASATVIVRAYFLLGSSTGNAGLVPVLREIPATVGVGAAAMRQLIAGPNSKELGATPAVGSAVPPATRLLGLNIKSGTATVDLSSEFAAGYNPSSPDARFAQVVYTLTQFSTVHAVVFRLDGQSAGGPFTRSTYEDAFLPGIFVDRPAWGAAAGNPARVTGLANVFEGTFQVQLEDASGKVLADAVVMASCGNGCWGDFATTLAYTVSKAQWGTLRVFDASAKDGTPENVTEYPAWLTPAG